MFRLIEAVILIVLSAPIAVLPLKAALKAGELLGIVLFFIWGSRRRIAISNFEKTMANGLNKNGLTPEQAIRENFRNLGRSLAEVIKIYSGAGRKIIDSVKIEGVENFLAAKEKGRGIVLLTGHCGNWELLASVLSVKVSAVAVVARPLNNPYLNRIVENVREKYGNSVIYKQGALRLIIQTLKNNGTVGILMDQSVVRGEGFIIDFLGRGAWTTKMPALITRKTGAAAIPVFIHRNGDSHILTLYPEVELSAIEDRQTAVIEDTKRFSAYIEKHIIEHPTEWLWIHRRWKRVKS